MTQCTVLSACQLWCFFQQWRYDSGTLIKCVAKVPIYHLPKSQRLRLKVSENIALTSPPWTVLSACQLWCCFQQWRYDFKLWCCFQQWRYDFGTLIKCVAKVVIYHLPKSQQLRFKVFENITLTSPCCWLSTSSSRSLSSSSCHLTVFSRSSAVPPDAPLLLARTSIT